MTTLFEQLSALLYSEDPIGLNFGDNADEYNPEAKAIIAQLPTCTSAQDVQRLVYEEMVQQFSPVPVGGIEYYQVLGTKIWAMWNTAT